MAHVEKKDVKENQPRTNQEAHRPDSIYNPHPFPLKPTQGNPWAAAGEYKQAPVDANTDNNEFYHPSSVSSLSDDYYPQVPMPDPAYYRYDPNPQMNAAYKEQSFSGQAETSNEADGNGHRPSVVHDSEAGHSEFPSTVETHDPNKLNEHKPSGPAVKAKPNVKRLWLRLAQLVASIGAFGFLVGAGPYSHETRPSNISKAVVVLMYIISAISVFASAFFVMHYLVRRCHRNVKLRRLIMILIDFILALALGIIVFFMILHNNCKPGRRWCDFYNTSIFFGMLAFVLYAGSIVWDIVGYFVTRKRSRS